VEEDTLVFSSGNPQKKKAPHSFRGPHHQKQIDKQKAADTQEKKKQTKQQTDMGIDMHQDFKTCAYFTLAKLKKEAHRHVELMDYILNSVGCGFATPNMELLRVQTISTEDFQKDVRKLKDFYQTLYELCAFQSTNKNMTGYSRELVELLKDRLHETVQHDLVAVEAYLTYQSSYATINRCNTTMRHLGLNCEALSLIRPLRLIKKFLDYCFLRCTQSMQPQVVCALIQSFESHQDPPQQQAGGEEEKLNNKELHDLMAMCSTIEQVHDLICNNLKDKCSQSHWDGATQVWEPPKRMQIMRITAGGAGSA
jgi:hypothetical protein